MAFAGDLVRRFGAFEHTPYPIGVDVSKTGDVLVADSHGNHFHILVCSKTGQRLQDFECTQLKVFLRGFLYFGCICKCVM